MYIQRVPKVPDPRYNMALNRLDGLLPTTNDFILQRISVNKALSILGNIKAFNSIIGLGFLFFLWVLEVSIRRTEPTVHVFPK